MLVLALDSALDACSAAVVETDGAAAEALAALDLRFAPVPGTVPDIVWVARLGARTALTPPRAFYVRPPDAKPQDAARMRLP